MKKGLLLGATLGVINPAVMLVLDRMLGRGGDFGWYAYSPMPRLYADYQPPDHIVNGRLALAVALAVLGVVNSILVVAFLKVHERSQSRG